jgi:DNA-binding PadR family transcriptional regulator
MKFDLSEVVDGIRGLLSSAVSGAGNLVKKEPSDSEIRLAVLSVLAGEAKNGKEVIQAIQLSSGGTLSPEANKIYPLLEILHDEKLVSIKIEKELRVYSLTKEGKKSLEESAAKLKDAEKVAATSENNWVKTSSENLKAGAKLAQALAQVAQHGTPDQQKRAAELVDETRRKVYAILAEG